MPLYPIELWNVSWHLLHVVGCFLIPRVPFVGTLEVRSFAVIVSKSIFPSVEQVSDTVVEL